MDSFFNANSTAFEAPPLPKINALFLPSNIGIILCVKPIISVLCPTSFSLNNLIVLTAPISFASLLSLSKNGIMLSL